MKKNDIKTGIVNSFGSNGEGVIKDNGLVTFVPYCMEGETVRYKILKCGKDFSYGKVEEIITPSKDRVLPVCPVFTKCGGCQLQHVSYEKQLEIKRNSVQNCFDKIAFSGVIVGATVPCEKQTGYRNKLQLPVQKENGKTKIGFYANNSHRVIEIDDCPINPPWTKTLIKVIKEFIESEKLDGYSEVDFSGTVREVTAKEVNGYLIITLVVTDFKKINATRLTERLDMVFKDKYSLFLNQNKSRSNVIFGEDFRLIKGVAETTGELFDIKFKIGVMSFMQVNDEMCKKLYSFVKENLSADKDTTVIDAYSGAGLMTALLAKDAKCGIGIEIVKEAVDCANQLAKDNNLTDKITNHCGKCEDILPKVIKRDGKLALVLDPPRKGCDSGVIKSVIDSGIERIVYVSCMPSTLARDVGLLTGTLAFEGDKIVKNSSDKRSYRIVSVTPFDMFPLTKHVETLVCLTRVNHNI